MVLSIGEILVDIFKSEQEEQVFAGGAPFNIAANIAHFKGDISFIGSVGNDNYGAFLVEFAKKRVTNSYIKVLDDRETSQAIVSLHNGERSFKFNRSNGSDYLLDLEQVKELDYKDIKIVHIGSLMLSYEEGKEFFFNAVEFVKRNTNAKVSFDVNYRDDIFESEEKAKEIFISAIKEADILKFTEEELELLTGEKDILKGLKSLLNDKQVAVVTLGKEGSIFYSKDLFIKVPTYPLKPMDTTGAGDAFYSYFLYSLDKGLDLSNKEDIYSALKRANVVGGIATSKKGAIDVAPSLEEIEVFLKSKNN